MAKTTEQLLAEYQQLVADFDETNREFHRIRKKYYSEKRQITKLRRRYGRVLALFANDRGNDHGSSVRNRTA